MKTLKEKEVVVTGAAGFIGSHLCRTLLEQGAKVTAYDNLYSGKIKFIEDLTDKEGFTFVQKDIRDTAALEEATKNSEVIFHLAAQTSVPFSMENPQEDCKINVVGTVNVLEAAKKAGARLVFASSCAVYGNPERPTPETHPTKPIAFYGLTKLLGENYLRFYQEIYGLEVVMLRIFNVYGPNCHGVLYDFLNKLQKTPDKLEILGTGKQSRDFVYIADMVNALLKAATVPEAAGQAFNIGTGKTTSVAELAKMLINILKLKNVEIYFTGGQAWAGDMDITQADNSKATKLLQWKPQVSLEEGLKKLISSGKY